MQTLFMCLALISGQMNAFQDRPVVRLRPHKAAIEIGFDRSLLELIDGPAVLYLPPFPPQSDAQGTPWSVDVKNLGPSAVTVTGKPQFEITISVGQTVHIYSDGTTYFLKR
jgi:hypothetical protein